MIIKRGEKSKAFAVRCVFLMFASGSAEALQTVDVNLSDYQKVNSLSGYLISMGSDTLARLLTRWAGEFKLYYPGVHFQIQAAGSTTAPPALTEGTINLAAMSRKMNDKELGRFEKKYGYKPTLIPVAIDAVAVYVNKDNPINGMTIAQIDAMMSSTRLCGYSTDISTWGDAGLTGLWKSLSVDLYGRNSLSGTKTYFKSNVLCQGKFKNKVNEQSGSADVMQSISNTLNGMGYAGVGYKSAGVKALALARKEGMPYFEATADNAVSGKYPLTRFLYFYVNKKPKQDIAFLEKEFIKWVLSKQGQKLVIREGYVSLPAKVVDKTLSDLEIHR